MTKAKKVLSLVLAVVMVAAMFAFSASAAAQNATFTVSVDKTPVTVGEEITVTVNLETDYYTASTNVPVYYDPAVFEFVAGSVVTTPIFGAGTTGVMSYNDEATGCLKVGFYPDTTAGDATAQIMNGTLFTFKLRAIANDTSDIALHAEDQKSATNVGGTLYCGAYASSVPDNNPATVGQTFTINNTTATVGSTMQPADLELTATGETDGVVIDTRMTLGGQYAGVVYGFKQINNTTFRANNNYIKNSVQATNGGSIEIARSFNTLGWSTGTTITVKNSDGSDTGKVYVVVIFADVNCDGLINGNDTTACKSYAAKPATLTNLVIRLAANCQNLGNATMLYNVNGNDTTAVKAYVGNASNKVSQATLAATFQKTAVNAKYA